MTYAEKLKDPRWQRKRLEILERDGFKCIKCGDTKKTLHVHHVAYLRKTEPWDHPSSGLLTLCETCHSRAEYTTERFKELMCKAGKRSIDLMAAILSCDSEYAELCVSSLMTTARSK